MLYPGTASNTGSVYYQPCRDPHPLTEIDGAIFADGFETGDTAAWSSTVP